MASSHLVLTAAHCVKDSWLVRWMPMDAVAGAHDVHVYGSRAQIQSIAKRIPHPLYKGDFGLHDVAVLKTKMPFTFTHEVKPVRLPQMDFRYNDIEQMILTGWGVLRTTSFFPALPSKLQEVEVTYVSYEECRRAVDKIKSIFEKNPLNKKVNICTGPLTGGIAACSGDSGGPLIYYKNKNIDNDNVEIQLVNETNIEAQEKENAKIKNHELNRDLSNKEYIEQDEEDDIYDDQETNNIRYENNEFTLNIVVDNSEQYFSDSTNNTKEDTEDYEEILNNEIGQEFKDDDETPIVLGIVSWGVSPCGSKGAPTVYTKVSAYLDFIQGYMLTKK